MMISNIASLSCLLGFVIAGKINLKSNATDDVYFERSANGSTIGYSFSLYQNVLSVQLNATGSCSSCNSKPANMIVMPQLMLEYNDEVSANSTTHVYGFLDKANANTDWGSGLNATKHTGKSVNGDKNVDVWEIDAEWKNPDGSKPKFGAQMYFAQSPATYQGLKVDGESILLRFSILDFPYNLTNSSIGYEQFVLYKTSVSNVSMANITSEESDGSIMYLRVNNTALVDGKAQNITVGQLNNTAETISIVSGNSTSLNITGYFVDAMFLGFNNSGNAKNITFEQRLGLNITELKNSHDTTAQNASSSVSPSILLNLSLALAAMALALPALLL